MNQKWISILIIGLVLNSWGCSFRHQKDQPQESGALEDNVTLSFSEAQRRVFTPYCASCHSAGSANSDLNDYEVVQAKLGQIRTLTLETRAMPKGSTLPAAAFQYLEKWINAGGPKFALNSTNPEPKASPSPINPEDVVEEVDPKKVSFAMVKEKILAPKCIKCHVAKNAMPLDTYDAVKANIPRVALAVLEGSMPPKKPLNKNLMNLFKTWLGEGAFELPSAPLQMPEPNFASLKKNLFNEYCLKCHTGDKPRADVSFDSIEALRKSPKRPLIMEDAGEPDSNLIVHSLINSKDDKRMPPARTGPRLPKEVIEVVRAWILNGAPAE